MTATAKIFRANAAKERAAASGQYLTNRQEMHERSALMWDEMAQRLEDTEQLAIVNAEAKAERKAAEAPAIAAATSLRTA
jgi:hypothetical protein